MRRITLIFTIILLLSGCGNYNTSDKKGDLKEYKQDNGTIVKVPVSPKKVAVLNAFYVGDFIQLGVTPIAVPDWTNDSNILRPHLKNSTLIGEGDIEKLTSLKPDLIVADASDKNLKKYEKIAPTVSYNFDKYNYKEILKELGELTGKENQAQKWINHWEKQGNKDKKDIQKVTNGKTASVFESDVKGMYIYKNNWGRGLEIVHDTFGMPMTSEYKQEVNSIRKSYKLISNEEVHKYAGDYIFLSEPKTGGNSYLETNIWNNLPAVKNNRVIKYNAEDYWFTDPITLEHLRKKIKKEILNRD